MKHKIYFWIISFCVFIVLRFFSNILINDIIGTNYTNSMIDRFPNIYTKIFLIAIIIPLIETFFYFYLPYVIFSYFFTNKSIVYILFILCSTFLFSLDHKYHISYFINSIIAGMLYSTLYLLYSKKNMNPFWCVTLLHSSYNLWVLLSELFNK